MKLRSAKSIIWLWVFTLLIATMGVSVQQIYCYCVGETTLALFEAEDACIALKADACCPKPSGQKAHSCCEKPNQPAGAHDCTQKTTRFFQLKTEFTAEKKAEQQLPAFNLDALAFQPVEWPASLYCSAPSLSLKAAAEPPPLSGRMRCVRYGVFRC